MSWTIWSLSMARVRQLLLDALSRVVVVGFSGAVEHEVVGAEDVAEVDVVSLAGDPMDEEVLAEDWGLVGGEGHDVDARLLVGEEGSHTGVADEALTRSWILQWTLARSQWPVGVGFEGEDSIA